MNSKKEALIQKNETLQLSPEEYASYMQTGKSPIATEAGLGLSKIPEHSTKITKHIEFSWNGTLKQLASDKEKCTFKAQPAKPVPKEIHLVPLKITAQIVQNTTQHAIGVNFDGMRTDVDVITNNADHEHHLVIPAFTQQPIVIERVLYDSANAIGANFDPNSLYGWDQFDEETIRKSVLSKDDKVGCWVVSHPSPVLDIGLKNKIITPHALVSAPGLSDAYIVTKFVGEQCLEAALQYRKNLPFEDLSNITATIEREDRQEWLHQPESSNGAIGSKMENDYMMEALHTVRVSVEADYGVWHIGSYYADQEAERSE